MAASNWIGDHFNHPFRGGAWILGHDHQSTGISTSGGFPRHLKDGRNTKGHKADNADKNADPTRLMENLGRENIFLFPFSICLQKKKSLLRLLFTGIPGRALSG